MKRGTALILAVVILDAVGIGIVFPTLPALARALLHGHGNVATQYGLLLAAYAAATLVSAPILGTLSDRYGRRPVLLLSLAGAAFDNVIMALAPSLAFLYAGRLLAGVAGASLTVTTAYVADTTAEADRAGAFGRLNACFGIGFIAGPVLGGLLSVRSVRAPFFCAAILYAAGAVACFFFLPESRPPARVISPAVNGGSTGHAHVPAIFGGMNPLTPLRSVAKIPGAGALLYVIGTLNLIGQTTGALWVIYGPVRFGWSPAVVGFTMAFYGLLYALCQSVLPVAAERRLGQRETVLLGIGLDGLGLAVFSLVRSTLAALSLVPLFALAGLGLPALQAMLSARAGPERQGELQGVLTSLSSLTAIFAPVLGTGLFALLLHHLPRYPGAVWLLALVLYAPCFFLLRRPKRTTTA